MRAWFRASLNVALAIAAAAQPGIATARTSEAKVNQPAYSNHLARETSPYLRQHAHNPVDWYPWGEEALAKAKAEDRPIFLSIGYASCHWCHVMEHESFEDPAIAAVLAAHFIAIKVDREERPDLDAVYMAAVQAMTGSGGWPLTVFLTPDRKPFFGGTYFPPERRWGQPSLREVLLSVADAWEHRRQEIDGAAATLTGHLAPAETRGTGRVDAPAAAAAASSALAAEYDQHWGGFGSAPKFPTPSRLFFLIAEARRDDKARAMLARTLDAMAAGGMYDWLGGGFHRYSVDEKWLVPHFEKMLYDNALLARAYGEAGVAFDRPDWLLVARATAEYLLREMRGPDGAFYSSTDADSEGHEGRYFTWTADQVRDALPADEAGAIIALCELGPKGNFEAGASALRPVRTFAEVASELKVGQAVVAARVDAARRGLLAARARRTPPATDDKRLAGWNGMAVWSLAYLGAALPEPRYLDAARAAAGAILAHEAPGGRLIRSWRDGSTSGVETLEDVAWVAAALVQLYEADGDVRWLTRARALFEARAAHYQDASGALFDTPDDGPPLLTRPRGPTDGATPSAAGVLAATALRLAALTESDGLRATAERAIGADAGLLVQAPEACLALLQAAQVGAKPPLTLVIVGDPAWPSTRALEAAAWRSRPSGCVLASSASVPVPPATVRTVPLFTGRESVTADRARAYLCEGGACRLPVEEPQALVRLLVAAR